MSYPQLDVQLEGGKELLLHEVVQAMTEARKIIEKVGTTGIEHQHRQADEWMKKYFPNWS